MSYGREAASYAYGQTMGDAFFMRLGDVMQLTLCEPESLQVLQGPTDWHLAHNRIFNHIAIIEAFWQRLGLELVCKFEHRYRLVIHRILATRVKVIRLRPTANAAKPRDVRRPDCS